MEIFGSGMEKIRIRDGKNSDPGYKKNSDPGSEINIPDPQHCCILISVPSLVALG
jgi:hypothetical protein